MQTEHLHEDDRLALYLYSFYTHGFGSGFRYSDRCFGLSPGFGRLGSMKLCLLPHFCFGMSGSGVLGTTANQRVDTFNLNGRRVDFG